MQVEYELDEWDWRGVTRSIDIDPEDYKGMSADEIKQEVYSEIRRDAEQNLHLVYAENDVAEEILSSLGDNAPARETRDNNAAPELAGV